MLCRILLSIVALERVARVSARVVPILAPWQMAAMPSHGRP